MNLTNEEVQRYSRHLIMPEVGVEGQEKLKAASVLCIGAGGLGSPLTIYLAAAGVGHLGVVDFDCVDFTNLHRQIAHGTKDVGRPKLQSLMETIQDINPEVKVTPFETTFTSENAMEIAKDFDIIIDGTDNFQTRYLANDVSVLLGKPNVYGSIFRFEGQASVFDATQGPCYRCLYPAPPPPGMVPSCAEGGVLGVLPGLIGLIQATEAIKLILGKGEPLIGRLLLYNALEMRFRELKLRKDPRCPICGENPTITELIDYEVFCGLQAEPEESDEDAEITVPELHRMLKKDGGVVLVDVREPHEFEICHIEGAQLLPLSELTEKVNQLNTDDEIVLYCHHGARSMKALRILKQFGFERVKSLAGGIDAWAMLVDPDMPRY